MKPMIGIVICGCLHKKQYVSSTYIRAVQYSGGLPFLIPLTRASYDLAVYTSFCDGFLFCGGDDINPLLFGEDPAFGIGSTDLNLDLFQIRLMEEVLKTQKPVLAICRGIQVLNVACEGSVCQDMTLQPDTAFNHMQTSASRSDISHLVTFTPDSRLYSLIGPQVYTNSYHHQALGTIGKNLTVSGTTSDGIVEAVEMPSHPFVIGVQWHPECMFRTSAHMRTLFHSFLKHCSTPKEP